MSLNQSRSKKRDSQFRKPGGGRSGNNFGGQQRKFSGGRGRGAAGPPTSSHPASAAPSSARSYKQATNAQGGQSRVNPSNVNTSDNNTATAAHSVENAGVQSSLPGVPSTPALAPIPKPTDASSQKTGRPLPRPPSSQPSTTSSDSALPSIPVKGIEGKGFPLQFGSLSPGLMNGMQVPSQTSSAPPNLDEQKRDQARRDAQRAVPAAPLPSALKQDLSKKDVAVVEKVVAKDTQTGSKAQRDVQVTSASSLTQAQKPPAFPITGISMPMSFHQQTVPMQFGGPNPQVQSQVIQTSSLQTPMQMPLQMGNPSQVSQQVFVQSLQHPYRAAGFTRSDRRGNGAMDATERWKQQPGPFPTAQDPRMDLAYGSNAMGFSSGRGLVHGVLRNPRAQSPVQSTGVILSGPMHSLGFQGLQRNNSDADCWLRSTNFNKGLMPVPQIPVPVMHKAERKYEVFIVTDEVMAKQRKLKGILNKLTPQNFERLFEQVKEVNIDNVLTLVGVVSQIFDKALTKPTFCEMYANLCQHLASELPDFSIDNEKITFRRLLLNKCQEEFERREKEEQEANNNDKEGDTELSEAERKEKRRKVRRRMLGNIRLIGELYKKRMLTERIMHECIKKLLGQFQNPDEENIEALCKLMSTIGETIDHPKAKEHMDAYFDIMGQLSNNMKLSSRVRFMLRDSIDLRKNKWQQRRKVEGPKKIEEVHRDAAQERQGQAARLNRGPSMNSGIRRGQPLDFGPLGSMLPSPMGVGGSLRGMPQVRGFGGQDPRMDDTNFFESRTLSVPLLQRSSADESSHSWTPRRSC